MHSIGGFCIMSSSWLKQVTSLPVIKHRMRKPHPHVHSCCTVPSLPPSQSVFVSGAAPVCVCAVCWQSTLGTDASHWSHFSHLQKSVLFPPTSCPTFLQLCPSHLTVPTQCASIHGLTGKAQALSRQLSCQEQGHEPPWLEIWLFLFLIYMWSLLIKRQFDLLICILCSVILIWHCS